MPECKLGLNDRVLLEAQGRATKGKSIDLEDIKFHQYVCLTLFLFYENIFLFLMLVLKLYMFDEGVFAWPDLKMIEQFHSYHLMDRLI